MLVRNQYSLRQRFNRIHLTLKSRCDDSPFNLLNICLLKCIHTCAVLSEDLDAVCLSEKRSGNMT